jgi:hypothetical protein
MFENNYPKNKYCIIDLDGTLCQIDHRIGLLEKKDWKQFYEHMIFDKPYPEFIEYLNKYRSYPISPLFITGRPEIYRTQTEMWLSRYWSDSWDKPPNEDAKKWVKEAVRYKLFADRSTLVMRKDKDYRPAPIVKKELLLSFLELKGIGIDHISCAFDDNEECIEMFQELGILAFHVKHPLNALNK